jgi:DNA-binding NarL/FixJ family response regulator
MQAIKVMIVDDHLIVREGLRQLLELEGDIQVVAEASSGAECLQLLERHRPDLILMDVRMPGISGIETTRLICEKYPNVKVIVLTIYDDDQYVKEAIQAGAMGYVLKKVNREDLVNVIKQVTQGGAFLDPAVTSKVFDYVKRGKTGDRVWEKARLTRRELDILSGLQMGRSDHDIASTLHLSEHTVRSHLKNIYKKLNVSSRSQAVLKAVRERIIDINDDRPFGSERL